MRLYELLNPSGSMPMPPSSAATAPMVNPTAATPPAPTASVQPPVGQQANMLTDFFSTPHPIGGAPAAPAAPTPPSAAQNMINNNSFIGDINRGLGGGGQPPAPAAAGPKPPGSP